MQARNPQRIRQCPKQCADQPYYAEPQRQRMGYAADPCEPETYSRKRAECDKLTGALAEITFWVKILSDHLKFIRAGIDMKHAAIIDEADAMAKELDCFLAELETMSQRLPEQDLCCLMDETVELATEIRNFKRRLAVLIHKCKVLAILPAAVLDHTRRETDFFIAILAKLLGEPTPPHKVIGIPDGNDCVNLVPRKAIPCLRKADRFELALAEIMFFSRISGEHAMIISMTVRPGVQEKWRQRALAYQKAFLANLAATQKIKQPDQKFVTLVNASLKLILEFRAFLTKLYQAVSDCSIPTGQTNVWPTLINHLIMESNYFIEVLRRVRR